MTTKSVKNAAWVVGETIDGSLQFTAGVIILIGGLLLGFFPDAAADIRSTTVRRFNSHLLHRIYSRGDTICSATKCSNCLWVPYSVILITYLSYHLARFGVSIRHPSLMIVASLVVASISSFVSGRWAWRRKKVDKVRARLNRLNDGDNRPRFWRQQ